MRGTRRRVAGSLLRAALLVVCLWTRAGDGYSCPYGEHCAFEPAPPGQVPRCALPGLTYCVHPEPYPEKVIKQLIETGTYDIRTLLSDESPDEFSVTWRRPATRYGPPDYPYSYGPHSLSNPEQVSLVNEPVYIPKPDYSRFRSSFGQDFFSQKTPLHPPTAGDPYNPTNLPTFQVANYTNPNGIHGLPDSASGKIWGQPSSTQGQVLKYTAAQAQHNKKLFRQNSFGAAQNDYFNDPQNDYYDPYNLKFRAPSSGWLRHPAATSVTSYNPAEWWRYVNPHSRADVTIERSISLPPSTTVYFPGNGTTSHLRRRRRRSPHAMSGAEALRIAFRMAKSEVEADRAHARSRRQSPNVIQLCQSRSQYVTPRAALNNQGNWRYVVNMADNMTQLVKAEICTSSECNGICTLPLGYSSRCEQKYVQKRLVALQASGQNLYTDVFWIPSCCQCTIISN